MRTQIHVIEQVSVVPQPERQVGDAFKMSVETARETAIRWNHLNRKGAIFAELEAEKYRRQTFRHVLEDYIATLPFRPQNRKAKADARTLRREFLDPGRIPWLDRPIREVRGADVQRAIEAIRDRAPTQAVNVFGLSRRSSNGRQRPREPTISG